MWTVAVNGFTLGNMKRTKPKSDERRDVTIKRMDMAVWRAARLAAMEAGVRMADYVAAALRRAA